MEKSNLLQDILTGDNLKGSSKKVQMFLFGLLAIGMVIADMWANGGKLNTYAFPIVCGMSGLMAGLGITDKKVNEIVPKIPEPSKTKTDIHIEKTETDPQ